MKKMDGLDALQRYWMRREVLAAGGVALLGLAGCGANSVPHTTIGSNATPTSGASHTLMTDNASPTPKLETPITMAFTGLAS